MHPIAPLTLVALLLVSGCAAAQTVPSAGADPAAPHVPAGPRAALCVLNKSEASVTLLDPATNSTLATLPVGEGPHEAATAPQGDIVVVCNYGGRQPGSTLTVLDPRERRVVRTVALDDHRPHGIRFTPDGERVLVTAEQEGKLLIVDPRAGEVVAAIDTKQAVSHMVALGPEGRLAFVANIGSGSVSVIDLDARRLVRVVPTGAGAEGIAAHPTRGEVWVTNREADTVSVLSSETLEVVAELPCASFPIRVAFTPDGGRALVSCARSGDVAIFDVAMREESRRIPMRAKAIESEGRLFAGFEGSPTPVGILIEPSGRFAFVANTNADIVSVIDLESEKVVRRLTAGREPDGMAWVPLAP